MNYHFNLQKQRVIFQHGFDEKKEVFQKKSLIQKSFDLKIKAYFQIGSWQSRGAEKSTLSTRIWSSGAISALSSYFKSILIDQEIIFFLDTMFLDSRRSARVKNSNRFWWFQNVEDWIWMWNSIFEDINSIARRITLKIF